MFDISQVQMLLTMLGETLAVSATIAVSVLAGYAIYQLAIIASWIYFAKFVVIKVYELINKQLDRPKIYHLNLRGNTVGKAVNDEALQELANMIEVKLERNSFGYSLPMEIRQLTNHISKYGN